MKKGFNKISQTILVLVSSFFLFLTLDLFFGNNYVNFFIANNKPVISHSVYHHDLDRNVSKFQRYSSVGKYRMCTNEYGFKSNCNTKNKQSKFINYAFIGDSFTEGVGLNYEDTFVGKFAKKKNSKVVVNLGVGLYSPKIYYKKIQYLLNQGFKFERIIIFIDVGDIYDENSYELIDNKSIKSKSALESINLIYQDYSNLYKTKKILKTYLPVTFLGYPKIKNLRNFIINNNKGSNVISQTDNLLINSRWTYENKFSEKDSKWIKKGIDESKHYIDKIFELGKTYDFEISLAVYPWPAQILYDDDTGKVEIGNLWKIYCKNRCEYFINYLDDFHEMKKRINKNKIVKLYYFKNDVHFNKIGNDFIFNKLIKIFN